MRSTVQIVAAAREGQPATEDELRHAVCAISAMNFTLERAIRRIGKAAFDDETPSIPILMEKIRASNELLLKLWAGRKRPMDLWLGPGLLPGVREKECRNDLTES